MCLFQWVSFGEILRHFPLKFDFAKRTVAHCFLMFQWIKWTNKWMHERLCRERVSVEDDYFCNVQKCAIISICFTVKLGIDSIPFGQLVVSANTSTQNARSASFLIQVWTRMYYWLNHSVLRVFFFFFLWIWCWIYSVLQIWCVLHNISDKKNVSCLDVYNQIK